MGRNTMRSSVNNAMRQRLFTEYLNEQKQNTMETINLGYANGWGNKDREIFEELRKFKIEGSNTSENIGNCLNEYSFETIQENKRVKVIYKVDSSD